MTVNSMEITWSYTRNKEEVIAPSPSEPPEVYQLKAWNNRKVTSQNEAAITFKGTVRYSKTEIIPSQVKWV